MRKEVNPAVAAVLVVLVIVLAVGFWFIRGGPSSKPAKSQQTNAQAIGGMLQNPATVKAMRDRIAEERAKGLRP